jgi:hypothetical protein
MKLCTSMRSRGFFRSPQERQAGRDGPFRVAPRHRLCAVRTPGRRCRASGLFGCASYPATAHSSKRPRRGGLGSSPDKRVLSAPGEPVNFMRCRGVQGRPPVLLTLPAGPATISSPMRIGPGRANAPGRGSHRAALTAGWDTQSQSNPFRRLGKPLFFCRRKSREGAL